MPVVPHPPLNDGLTIVASETRDNVDQGPQVPKLVLDRGVLAGSHMVTSLGKPDTVLVRELGTKIAEALPADTPNRESFARALAESVASGTSLRSLVSALSRGDVLHIPVGTDARQGTVTIRGEVADLVRHTRKEKFEYEGGGDRVVTLGETKGANKSGGLGLQGRGDFFKIMRVALDAFGVNRDKTRSDELTTSSKFFSRAKTTEVTEVFRGNLLVEVGYQPRGKRETDIAPARLDPRNRNLLTTPLEVGIPERETRPSTEADINKNLLGDLDQDHLRQQRLHSSNVLLDVHVTGAPHIRTTAREDAGGSVQMADRSRPQDTLPTRRQAMVGVVEALRESIVREKATHEQTVRERTADQDAADRDTALDDAARADRTRRETETGARLARAEEALTYHGSVLSERLVAEFGFRRLQQDFKGLTNGESVIVRVPGTDVWAEVKAASRGMRLVATTKDTEFNTGAGAAMTKLRRKVVTGFLQLQGGGRLGTDVLNVGASYGKRWGKDRIIVSGRTLETAVTTKTKENGAVLDGDGYLEVTIHKGDEKLGDTIEVPVGFRSLMPQSDLLANQQKGPVLEAEYLLPESAVIRDIGSLAEVRSDLERVGREQYGSLWPQIRTEVMQIVTQPSLASKLGAMSRGDEFELTAFDRDKVAGAVAALAQRGLKVTVKATLTHTQLLRTSEKADLSRQNESSSFRTEQRYTSKFDLKQGAVGYAPVSEMPSGQVQLSQEIRVRGGVRDDVNDKLYSNSKIREAQEIHGGRMNLTVVLEGGGFGTREVSAGIDTEFSVKSRTDAPATGGPGPLPRNELSAASVVSFRNEPGTPGGDRLFQDVRNALKDRFQWRGGVSDSLERTLRSDLGAVAMQAKLSELTRGGVLKVPVAGPGWSAEVVVRAVLRAAPVTKYTVNDAEFEVGTQNRTGHGVMRDIRDRVTGVLGLTGRAQKEQGGGPGLTVTGDYSYRHESSTGGNLQSSGTAVNRAKNVSTAVVSDVDVQYQVEIRGWTGGLVPSTTKLDPITMPAEVVTPQYGVLAPADVRAVPDRIWQDHVLGSSDVVTNVFRPSGPAATVAPADFGKAVLRGSNDPGEFGGRNVQEWLHGLGRSGLRHKLYDALSPNNLHDQLKTMMSGRELVVSDGGVTVRIGASVKRLAHEGNTTTTEFNTGTNVEHTHSAADGATGGGSGSSHQLRAGVAVSTGLFYAGDTLAASSSNSTRETWSNRTGSGNTTKVKPVGNVFTGEANLHFSVEWKDLVSTEGRFVMVTKRAYFRREVGMDVVIDVAETRETVPGNPPNEPNKDFVAATAPRGAALRRGLNDDRPVAEATPAPPAQIPPPRVWTHGLVDTDVVRDAGMSPDARKQLTDGAEEFLGSDNWDRVRGMVERMIDPVALASRLVTPHTPDASAGDTRNDASNPAPEGAPTPPGSVRPTLKDGPGNSTLLLGRTDLAGDVQVEVRMKIKELEFVKTDTRSDSNPTNTSSVTDGVRAQRALRVANRITGGVVTPDTFGMGHASLRGGIYVDTAYERRTDVETVEGGQIVNNAKISTPTARYRGFAEVEVIYHKGELTMPRMQLMAIEIDIPAGDTTPTPVPHNGFLRFHDEAQSGELRLHGAPPDALKSVAGALGLDVGAPSDHERILRVGHIARRLLPESLTVEGPRGERWLRGLDRLLDLAANEEAGTPFDRLRDAMAGRPVPVQDRRRLQDLVEHVGADLDLAAGDANGHWEVLGAGQEQPQQPQQGGQRQPDLSLREPTVPDVRWTADAADTRSMSRLLDRFRATVLQEAALRGNAPRAEGDTRPPVVEVTLDGPVNRAQREADALERRLRTLSRGLTYEVDVVIRTVESPVRRAAAPGEPAGAVRSFRIGPETPDAEDGSSVRRADDGVIRQSEEASGALSGGSLPNVPQVRRPSREDGADDHADDQADGHAGNRADEQADDQADDQADNRADEQADNRADDHADDQVDDQADNRADDHADDQVDDQAGNRADEQTEDVRELPGGPLSLNGSGPGQGSNVPLTRRRDGESDEAPAPKPSVRRATLDQEQDAGLIVPGLSESRSQENRPQGNRSQEERSPENREVPLLDAGAFVPRPVPSPDDPRRRPTVPTASSRHDESDDSLTSDSLTSGSSSPIERSEGLQHERTESGDSMVTAPLWPVDAATFYQHEGARLGDDSDNASVDSDLPDLPHERDASGTSWRTARLYEGEEDFYQHAGARLGDDSDNASVDSDLLDSRSEQSEDSWVEVQPPRFYQQGSNVPLGSETPPVVESPPLPPLPPHEAGGPPRIEEPAPQETLEDSIFTALTQMYNNGRAAGEPPGGARP
ncbi:hypothetical protein [Kitasatospora sp. NPDC002965]|uniref:hypothetical protein n=1 Tax=Kitasatospora sp. NPDC002965 TaxID=3154775 RepID=UPI0033AE8D7A